MRVLSRIIFRKRDACPAGLGIQEKMKLIEEKMKLIEGAMLSRPLFLLTEAAWQ
jgi:hypothetical protein